MCFGCQGGGGGDQPRARALSKQGDNTATKADLSPQWNGHDDDNKENEQRRKETTHVDMAKKEQKKQ